MVGWAFKLCGLLSLFVTVGIAVVLFAEAAHFFGEVSVVEFLFGTEWTPLFTEKHFGILPLVLGTLLVSAIAMIVAIPLGILIAVYLSEYASARVRRSLKPILEILASIPTIVFGYFALLSVTPFLQKIIPGLSGFNALSPGIVMGIMILPFVVSLTDDAMTAVPHSLRMAAYGLGSTRLQVAFRVVLPSASSGVIAACVLAVSRAVGETMLVAIAAGMRPTFTLNPLVPVQTITAYIVQVSLGDTPAGTLEYRSIFAVASVLFVLTFILNMLAQKLRASFKFTYA
ncbi:MAG: phosphate ABC transporter permease subunit PstC [Candidatus Peregrinibacteria bacterium]|nr:phosphate ABC transporter permease subunit PstC [Candidatus Peregrinibacteria bacterium]